MSEESSVVYPDNPWQRLGFLELYTAVVPPRNLSKLFKEFLKNVQLLAIYSYKMQFTGT